MNKKSKIILSIIAILSGIYVLYLALQDDVEAVKKAVINSLHQANPEIAHIEFLDTNKAIAFYETGHMENRSFGSAVVEKTFLGWNMVHASSSTLDHGYKLDWGFSNLQHHFTNYTDLIRGKIMDSKIDVVKVKTHNGNEYIADLVEYNDDEKLWFLVTDGEDLIGSTITGSTLDGQILEQISK